ncbi:MAG: FlgD immunoglobulin-like domain containing protein, partial [Promethearchaeota archaeon]
APNIITCYDHGNNFIDSLEVEVETQHDELDLNIIEIFLHKEYAEGHFEHRVIEMIFNKQKNVEPGIRTYFGGTSFQTCVYTRPDDFDAGLPQVIKVIVDPYDDTAFPKEYDQLGQPKWMGIIFKDLDGNADSWGNISLGPFLPDLNSFTALPLEKEIKIMWSIGSCPEAVGINLYRSKFKNDGFIKINNELINIVNSDSQVITEYTFVDRDVVPKVEYFYKLEKVLKDGRTQFFSEMVSAMIISGFVLNQNYPNPFNSLTIINYDIDSEEPVVVSLCIYNVLGQKVKTLVQEEKSTGLYQIEWDGTDEKGNSVSSGVYFYVLKTDKNIDKKKMLLLK